MNTQAYPILLLTFPILFSESSLYLGQEARAPEEANSMLSLINVGRLPVGRSLKSESLVRVINHSSWWRNVSRAWCLSLIHI